MVDLCSIFWKVGRTENLAETFIAHGLWLMAMAHSDFLRLPPSVRMHVHMHVRYRSSEHLDIFLWIMPIFKRLYVKVNSPKILHYVSAMSLCRIHLTAPKETYVLTLLGAKFLYR